METVTFITITSFLENVLAYEYDESDESEYYLGKPTIAAIIISSLLGLIITVATAAFFYQRSLKNQKLVPRIKLESSGRVVKLERFSHYVGNYNILPASKRLALKILSLLVRIRLRASEFPHNLLQRGSAMGYFVFARMSSWEYDYGRLRDLHFMKLLFGHLGMQQGNWDSLTGSYAHS